MKYSIAKQLAATSFAVLVLSHFGICSAGDPAPNQATAPTGSESRVPTEEELRKSVAELRARLPYKSLSKRLKYEMGAPKLETPKLSEEAARRLDHLEQGYSTEDSYNNVRAKSLAALHSDKVMEFMRSEGFGFSRMVRIEPSPTYLELPPSQPIPLAQPNSAEQRPGPKLALPQKELVQHSSRSWSPSGDMLLLFHDRSRESFVNFWGLGHVKDRDHVAGFTGHEFRYLPPLLHPKQEEAPIDKRPDLDEWKTSRLELVGLLRYKEPKAYVSTQLPKMSELTDAKTRKLDSFESQALKSLQHGEDLVTDAHVNKIRMLGAIRAVKQCRECHEVDRGALLGAFSYDLFRDPPLAVTNERSPTF